MDELMQYNSTLRAGQSAVQQFHNDMQQYQTDIQSSSGSKSKRQNNGGVLTATLRVDLENIHGDFSLLKVVQASISAPCLLLSTRSVFLPYLFFTMRTIRLIKVVLFRE